MEHISQTKRKATATAPATTTPAIIGPESEDGEESLPEEPEEGGEFCAAGAPRDGCDDVPWAAGAAGLDPLGCDLVFPDGVPLRCGGGGGVEDEGEPCLGWSGGGDCEEVGAGEFGCEGGGGGGEVVEFPGGDASDAGGGGGGDASGAGDGFGGLESLGDSPPSFFSISTGERGDCSLSS